MTFPPPNDPHQPGNHGGFGPPQQGFGPPAQPGGPPHMGGPPMPPGGQMPPGGYGAYPPPPPPPPRRNNTKTAVIAVVSVLAVAVVAGIVVAATGGDDSKDDKAKNKPTDGQPSASAPRVPSGMPSIEIPKPSGSPGQGAPVGGGTDTPSSEPSADASETPSDLVPYVVLSPGTCFDHPGLDTSVKKVEKRSCSGPHDGEVISNATLTGTFSTEKEIQTKALSLCESAAKSRMKTIPATKTYYYYALYPSQPTYSIRGQDQVSCSLTLSSTPDGPKLTEKLPK
ncbi:hypothetical protein [Streptomyces buecherae]|uniref:hypothetical protein n=1 Tax=Streptomyces buecherae TaxID=2763006 RepID=UPI0036D13F0C